MRRAGRAPARGEPPGNEEAGPGPASSFSSDTPDPWWYPGKIEWTANPNRRISYRGFHGEHDEFVDVMLGVLRDAGLFRSRQMPRLDEPAAEMFFDRVFEAFKPVPYHCAFRGQETAAAAHALLRQMRARRHGPIDDVECLATLIAACAGSIGHLGLSNQHLRLTNHALCGLYPGDADVVERHSALILLHFLTDPVAGLALKVSDDAATRDAFARLIERLVLDRHLEARELVVRTHYGTAERLRAEAVAGTGLESFESRGDDDDSDAGHVSRHVSLPPGAALSAREKLVALRAVIVCAEASATVMPLARADFWGNRELLERAGEREARAAFEFDSGARRRASTRSLSDEYFERQVDEMARTTLPAFEAIGAFCDAAFTRAVLCQARANVGTWRERLATSREARARAERANRCSLAYIDAVGCFGMIVVYAASRQSVIREKIQYVKGIARGFASDASVQASAAEAAAQFEHVRRIFASFAGVCVASLVACLALATPRAKRRVPEAVRERFLYLVCLAQVSARFFFTHHRHALNAVMSSLHRATGAPSDGAWSTESLFRPNIRTRIAHGPVVVPCVTTLFYYSCMTHLSPREHALFHALAVFVRFSQDESAMRGDETYVPLAYAPAVARKWRAWRAVAAFVVVVCAADWRHARQIFPRALRRRVAAALFPGRERAADPRPGDPETDSRAGRRDGIFSSVLCRS